MINGKSESFLLHNFYCLRYSVCTQMGIKKLKKLEIKKIEDLKIGIGIEKKAMKQG